MVGGDFEARFIDLIEDMTAAWREAPNPQQVVMPEMTRASLSDAGAIAVIWGWTARVMRMAESALLLHRAGFDTELAPLVRSMLEHAIALPWVADNAEGRTKHSPESVPTAGRDSRRHRPTPGPLRVKQQRSLNPRFTSRQMRTPTPRTLC